MVDSIRDHIVIVYLGKDVRFQHHSSNVAVAHERLEYHVPAGCVVRREDLHLANVIVDC